MMIPVYVSLVQAGKRTLEQVPERIRDAVAKELAETNPEM
jgi:NADH dehydrogenase FAD-containing subunit